MTQEQKAKAYDEAIERARTLNSGKDVDVKAGTTICEYIFPELKESEDERMIKSLKRLIKAYYDVNFPTPEGFEREDMLAWLEKQGTSYTKRDVDDAYLEGMAFAKNELEKQSSTNNLSEEVQNRFAKGVLTSCALSFIDYLDAHKYEGKMCVSNGECEDIENAFHNAMWDRLHRYYCKYIERQGEQKPFDAFIEKAATWFANRYQVNGYLDADDIEDFKNYMKGE